MAFVPDGEIEHDVARHRFVQLRRAGSERRCGGDRRRKLPVLERDRLGGILRERCRLRYHQCDRLAHVTHAPAGQRITRRHELVGAAAAFHRRRRGHRLLSRRRHVLARQHGDDALDRERGAGVDRNDVGVRPIGAQEMPVRLSRKIPVGDVPSRALQHALVFETALVSECRHGRGILETKRPARAGPFARPASQGGVQPLESAISTLQGA